MNLFGIDLLDLFIPVNSIIWSNLPSKFKHDFTSYYKNQIKIMNLEHGKEPNKSSKFAKIYVHF